MKSTVKVLLTVILVASGAAQNESTPKALIPLLVTDSHNRPVSGLTPASLVLRDHKSPVTDFRLLSAADLPLELGVLIDASASQRDTPLPDALKAATEFVNSVLRPGNDRAFFLTFADAPEATRWLKKEELVGVSITLKYGRSTALYDSIAVACQQRMGPVDRQHPSRRVLLVISDGDDNASHKPLTGAESEALKSGVVIFSVATQSSPMLGGDRGTRVLAQMSAITGGGSFSGLSRSEMPKVFATLKQLIEGMYYASYIPPNPNDAIHEVEVKPAAKEKIKVSYPEKYAWMP